MHTGERARRNPQGVVRETKKNGRKGNEEDRNAQKGPPRDPRTVESRKKTKTATREKTSKRERKFDCYLPHLRTHAAGSAVNSNKNGLRF